MLQKIAGLIYENLIQFTNKLTSCSKLVFFMNEGAV